MHNHNGVAKSDPLDNDDLFQEIPVRPRFSDETSELSIDAKEQILDAIGGFGKWQLKKCSFIVIVIWMPASFHLLNMVFFRAETDFWCTPPRKFPFDVGVWKNYSNPDQIGRQCHQYDIDYDSFNSLEEAFESEAYANAVSSQSVIPCSMWTYDRSFWKRTIIQEWDLVCEREWMQKLTQQVTFFGLLVGVFTAGVISDKLGRMSGMLIMLTMTIICGTGVSFAPTYPLFLVGIWGCGFSTIGYGTIMYCWMMELVSGREKTILGCVPHLNFAFWGLVTAVIAYLVPNWQQMELIFTLPLILLYSTYWVLPESPRWLLTHGRTDEAEKILRSIAAYNGTPLSEKFYLIPPHHGHDHAGKGVFGFLAMFRTPNLRRKALITFYLWFATTTVYYGLTLNSNSIGASLFVYFSFGKALEFPAIFCVILLLIHGGRRNALMTLFGVCGICLISSTFVPRGYFQYEWPIVLMNVMGRACSTGGLCLCYVFSAEVFPTVIRNVGISTASVWGRIGPIMVPYIAELAEIDPVLPIGIFGLVSLFASFLVTFLPETSHTQLPDTIQEGEEQGKGDTLYSSCSRNKKNVPTLA